MRSFLNCKQKEGESLQDYTRRFKTARDVMVSHIGDPICLGAYMKLLGWDEDNTEGIVPGVGEEYADVTDKAGYQKKAWGRFVAYVYLDNSDQAKYGSVLKGLSNQFSLKNNQFPTSIMQASNVLSNHPHDNSGQKKQKNSDRARSNAPSNDKEEEDVLEAPALTFAQLEGKCYVCGLPGHMSSKCKKRDKIPKDQWAINKSKRIAADKAQQHAQASSTRSSAGSSIQADQEESDHEESPYDACTWMHFNVGSMDAVCYER